MPKQELHKLKAMVAEAADLTASAREASERDRDYYDGYQWTDEEIAVLQRRKQPAIVVNRIRRKVDAMIGLEQRMRTDPVAYPRRPDAEQSAEAATKALVFVDDNTRFDNVTSQAFENLVVEGYGGVEIGVQEMRGQIEIDIRRLRWEEIFFDPHSREKDFSDAAYMGFQKWMSLEMAMSDLAGAWQGDPEELRDMLSGSVSSSGMEGETFEDRPLQSGSISWVDKKYRRVRIAQMYYLSGGVWYMAIFAGSGEVYNDVSPYLDEDGQPTCPMELMAAYVDRDNNRSGVVRSMIDTQTEINKRRSKALHLINSRQTIGIKGVVDSVAAMKRATAEPDGHIELNLEVFEAAAAAGQKPFEFMPTSDLSSGNLSLLQEAKAEIDMIGPNPSLIGQTEGGASGRAIMAQQQAGMAELAPLYDVLRDWKIRCYRQMWARIKQFWTDQRWIRVTDASSGTQEWVGLNIPTGPPQLAQDPQTGQVVQIGPPLENAVAEMDVDIVISDNPDHVTLMQEQFEQLAKMAQNGLPIPPEMIIESSSLKDKPKLLEMLQQQRAQQAQQSQMAMQMEGAKTQAEVQRDQAAAADDMASAQKKQIEAQRIAMGY